MERKLAADYIDQMTEVAQGLTHDNHALAMQLAGVPERIRGYGHVKRTASAGKRKPSATPF